MSTATSSAAAATLLHFGQLLGDAHIDAQRAVEDASRDRQLILERLLDQVDEIADDMNARTNYPYPDPLDPGRVDEIAARWIVDDPAARYTGDDYVHVGEHTRVLDLLRHARADIAALYGANEEMLTSLARAAKDNAALREQTRVR